MADGMTNWISEARVGRSGRVTRRDFLRVSAAGAAALGGWSWQDRLLAAAPSLRRQGKAVIVLWMQGGPSQLETFDPKPGTTNGGATKAIDTAVSGVQIAEFWPQVARQMKDITLIRSLTNKEGNHERATYQLHTGYIPSGSIKHPSVGSLIAQEIAPTDFELPAFVSIIGASHGPGFLPVDYAPFRVPTPDQMPGNTLLTVDRDRYRSRLGLLSRLERPYEATAPRAVADHQALYAGSQRLVTSPKLRAFDISAEPTALREKYGATPFGKGCLLARRLVEAGVTYVEVQLGNWDTHQDNNTRIAALARDCDPAFATLVADLKQRGLLDRTAVVWMGEFGRTPRINPAGGRDHFPRVFNAAVAGGGFAAGSVIGRSNPTGTDIADAPVTVNDFYYSLCKTIGVDPAKENQSPQGRPLKIVDGGNVVPGLLA